VLVHPSAVLGHHPVHRVPHRCHDVGDVFGVEPLRKGAVAAHVGEEDRHQLANLALRQFGEAGTEGQESGLGHAVTEDRPLRLKGGDRLLEAAALLHHHKAYEGRLPAKEVL
jgi:hypothetical protein